MNQQRRHFLFRALAFGCAGMASLNAWAVWPKKMFGFDKQKDALEALTAGKPIQDKDVQLIVPSIAENGGQVRVEVKTQLSDVEKIFVLAESNPRPLVAQFNFAPGRVPDVALNIKLGTTSNVSALVQTKNGFFRASQEVSVTAGGC